MIQGEGEPQRKVLKSTEAQRAAWRQKQARQKAAMRAEREALAAEVGRNPVKVQKVLKKPNELNIGMVTQAGNPQHSKANRSYYDDNMQHYGSGRDDK